MLKTSWIGPSSLGIATALGLGLLGQTQPASAYPSISWEAGTMANKTVGACRRAAKAAMDREGLVDVTPDPDGWVGGTAKSTVSILCNEAGTDVNVSIFCASDAGSREDAELCDSLARAMALTSTSTTTASSTTSNSRTSQSSSSGELLGSQTSTTDTTATTIVAPTFDSHANGDTVVSSSFTLTGNTTPGATVEIQIDSTPPAETDLGRAILGGILGGAPQPASTTQTVTADAEGKFRLPYSSTNPSDTSYAIQATASKDGVTSDRTTLSLTQQ